MNRTFNMVLTRRIVKILALTFPFLLPELAYSQWALVARHAISRIEQISQSQTSPGAPVTEVVAVILDAPAQRVFDVVINNISKNQNVNLLNSDPQKLSLGISQGDQRATLAVKPLSDDSSQLLIVGTAPFGQTPKTSRIVDGVMGLCNELGKECSTTN